MTALDDRLTAVLAYARLGIRVFPCHTVSETGACSCGCASPSCKNRGKHPRIREWQKVATDDPAVLRDWWSRWPDANIGAAMQPSGLIAADIDPRNGGDESWRDLASEIGDGGIPHTWTSLTGGGGVHFVFTAPAGLVCRTDQIAPGVDVKWHGYLILPPSKHKDGGTYEWEIGTAPWECSPAELPAALVRRVSQKPDSGDVPPSEGTNIAALLTRTCPEGERHNTLIRILGWARNVMRQAEAEAVVQAWNAVHCKPPLDDGYVTEQVEDTYRRWEEPARVDWSEFESGDEASAQKSHDWRVISARELRHLELPPIEWVLENRVPRGRYVVVSGESGVGKSWWVLGFALHAAIGMPFLGLETKALRTLYIDEENGIAEAQRRLRALMDGLGIAVDADVGVDFLIDESIKLDGAPVAAQLITLIEERGYDCVMTDSLIRFFDGKENNSDEVKRFHEVITAVRRRTGVTWFMLQHLNKAGANGDKISPGDRLRGSGEFKAYADVHLQLRGGDAAGTVVLHVEKLRGGVRPPDLVYRMDGNTLLEEPVTLTALGSTAATRAAEDAALTHAVEVLTRKQELSVSALIEALRQEYGVAGRTAERAIAIGRQSGAIVSRKVGKSVYLALAVADEG